YFILHNILYVLDCLLNFFLLFFFNDTATTEIYTLSLHDALPIYPTPRRHVARTRAADRVERGVMALCNDDHGTARFAGTGAEGSIDPFDPPICGIDWQA